MLVYLEISMLILFPLDYRFTALPLELEKTTKPFHVGVGLRQGCVFSPLLFIVYMNWIDKCSQADECAPIGNCKISRLLFADDLVLLSSTESGLQRALNSFADTCNTAGMKISTAKIEVLHLSRNPD